MTQAPPTTAPQPTPPMDETRLFGISVMKLTLTEVVDRIIAWAGSPPPRTVITANLDHVMKLRTNPAFQTAYREADLVTADGMPFVWLAKLEGDPLEERVTGSDLIEPLMEAAAKAGRTVYFFGSTMDRLRRAETHLTARNPDLRIAGLYAPPFGFETDEALHAELVEMFRAVRPDIIVVALGAPKQEIWASRMVKVLDHGVFLGTGAALDFLSDDVRRAPAWMQRTGLEWLYRALSEPKRLGKRYLRIIVALPSLYRMHRRDRATWDAARKG
ncbi:WecB/TagA/CpsF family glycosyltransferase [Acuticoccus sp. M5D2P5]|uniref:WecB/TagA/CpsF family glycosyltransferase n=1 Tax=Acuticoccus kalidii TaxID=2910977 RepID=UPI001F1DEC77|nr:WecB/TagA/CpsF family glycosyltransferase [Acuticoccus kalidii]MCF3933951.1 WecB/TagA/CpsF family glycosyltransferase [Acuticoccus kalidii]